MDNRSRHFLGAIFLSIVLGFLVQGKLTGNLWDKSSPDIYEQGLTGLWASQAVCFFAGVFLFAGLAAVNFIWPPPATSTSGNTASSGVISLQLPKKSTTTLILDQGSVFELKADNGKITLETK